MARKPLIITDELPYHIRARSNNQEWFYIPIDECWKIFSRLILEINLRFQFHTHAFVLMNNHYHLLGTASKEFPLPQVMEWFQRSANRKINDRAGRINHVFGGPYKASLISSEEYYYLALQYVYRNPVDAGIVHQVEDYKYSTLVRAFPPLVSPITGIASKIPSQKDKMLSYLNEDYPVELKQALNAAFKKSEFKIAKRQSHLLRHI